MQEVRRSSHVTRKRAEHEGSRKYEDARQKEVITGKSSGPEATMGTGTCQDPESYGRKSTRIT